MFLGHFAVGFAAKRAAPKVSLGTFFIAAQLQDLIWPLFLLLGIEHVQIDPGNTPFTPLDFFDYPYTHSLLGAVIIAAVFGHLYRMITGDLKSGLILSGVALSHWVLDFITHRPDLPLFFWGGPMVGLGLWNSVGGTVAVELVMFASGVALYLGTVKAVGNRARRASLWLAALIVLLLVVYVMNLLGPPPPGEMAIAIAGNLMWLFVFLGYRADRAGPAKPDQGVSR